MKASLNGLATPALVLKVEVAMLCYTPQIQGQVWGLYCYGRPDKYSYRFFFFQNIRILTALTQKKKLLFIGLVFLVVCVSL